MHEDDDQCFLESDGYKAYLEIEKSVGSCPPEKVRAMYCAAQGETRQLIALAVIDHIARGDDDLQLEFPELTFV